MRVRMIFHTSFFCGILCVFFHLHQFSIKFKSDEKMIKKSILNMASAYQNVLYIPNTKHEHGWTKGVFCGGREDYPKYIHLL